MVARARHSAAEDVGHPAPFNKVLFPVFAEIVGRYGVGSVLDTFAGKGGIFALRDYCPTLQVTAIEIEKRWADCHWATQIGDATNLPAKWTGQFDAIITSPTFGNRVNDSFEDRKPEKKYHRNTYRHTLGERLQPNNSGQLHFGCKYCTLHRDAALEWWRVLRGDGKGIVVIEVKDFYETPKPKRTRKVRVSLWFYHCLLNLGFEYLEKTQVPVPGNRHGANRQRVPYTNVMVFRKPAQS